MISVKQTASFSGRYNLIVRDAKTLAVKRETGWFDNLITDAGLNRIGSGGIAVHCMVGTGNATPTILDTALAAQVAYAGMHNDPSGSSSEYGASASAPYFGWHRQVYRFGEGVAAGNLSEVGVGWGGTSVFSRALIRDVEGNPTTITVLSNETLDVVYELRLYPTLGDQTGSFDVSDTTHDYVMRPARVTDQGNWAPTTLFEYGAMHPNGPSVAMVAYSGSISAITNAPNGTSSGNSGTGRQAYENNSMKMGFTSTFALAYGNLETGIKSLHITNGSGTLGSYQFELDPPIMKNNTQVLTLNFEVSWARKA
jgi:hypothetical protein